MYIDTHCHLSLEDYDDIDLVINENRENGVDKIIISGCTKNMIVESLELANKYSDVYVTIGFHPSEASITTDLDLEFLKEQLKNPKVVGVGEIGLDYHYGKEDMMQQQELFRKQVRLADELSLPVVIHSRDAVSDTIKILEEFPNVIGDIHCFSGSVEVAKKYISMGYKIGIGGVVTFKNSKLYQVVEEVGIDNILLETDAPYLTPEPFRSKKNSSKYLVYIGKKIADILKITDLEVAEETTQNAMKLFDLD